MTTRLTALFLVLALVIGCSQQKAPKDDSYTLGQIEHQFTVSDEAKESFDKGLLLLHSFEYDDGKEAFRAAQTADSTEVMAYWGEAMCHYKALWGLQDLPAGREIMARLGATTEERLSRAEAGLEREFWRGIEILYGEGEVKERNERYANHMKGLYEQYPEDLEVAAFYSLSLMWADYKDQKNLNRSSQVAAGIIKENPTHPGALHYMIHSNDDPEYARLAKNAADEYAKV
ncbi:MAG: hypothetical protein RJQ14_03180, partial [Marinoscillum sp.]